jgi:Cys-tRNA(Pro)/Cys-tRNA(Cys) deacylase
MTPAITAVKKANVSYRIHEYEHDASTESYGEEAADKLRLEHGRVFKTLVVKIDDQQFIVGLVPVSHQLDLKLVAKALGAKKAVMAQANEAEKITGYVLGGISPLGQKRKLETVIDASATAFDTIFVSAGRRGLEIELAPVDLCYLTRGKFAVISK